MTMTLKAGLAAMALMASFPVAAATFTVNVPDSGRFELYGVGDASTTYENVVFTQSSAFGNSFLVNVGSLLFGHPPVLSSQPLGLAIANIRITLPIRATSITLAFGTFDGSDVTFTLGDGPSTVQPTIPALSYLALNSYTGSSSSGFDTLLLTSPDRVLNIRSLTYTSTDPTSVIPEPATWAMLIVGFGLVGSAARRRYGEASRAA